MAFKYRTLCYTSSARGHGGGEMSPFYLRAKCVACFDARRGRGAAVVRCLLWPAFPASADSTVRPYTGSNYSNPPLEPEQLRATFSVRQTKWPDGTPLRVFVLPDRHALHIRFTKEVLGGYPYQLRSTWDRKPSASRRLSVDAASGVGGPHSGRFRQKCSESLKNPTLQAVNNTGPCSHE